MSNATLLLDYLFVGALIQARLKSNVVGLELPGAVLGIEEFSQATERAINAPVVYVLWEGDTVEDTAGRGRSTMLRQSWTVLIAVRNADQSTLDARNSSAGPLLSAVHQALAGWAPQAGQHTFVRTTGRKATYTANVGLYPLTFVLSLNA